MKEKETGVGAEGWSRGCKTVCHLLLVPFCHVSRRIFLYWLVVVPILWCLHQLASASFVQYAFQHLKECHREVLVGSPGFYLPLNKNH